MQRSAGPVSAGCTGERGHPEVVAAALLQREETDINLASRLRRTPLHLAAMQTDPQFAKALLRHSSIEPGLPDQNGKLPLHVAIESNNSAVAVMIAGHPKALPVSQWQIKTVQAVLACSGRVHLGARYRGNQIPHDVAVRRGHSSLAPVLSEQGTVRGTMDRAFHERLVQG